MNGPLPAAARWLGLAAAPTFALMALATAAAQATGGGGVVCGAPGAGPPGGMTLMYLLMSGFHLGPWLRRAAARADRHHDEESLVR